MSKLDTLRRGFKSDEEVEVKLDSYKWRTMPFGKNRIQAAKRPVTYEEAKTVVPMLRFDLWLAQVKHVNISDVLMASILDIYFSEYKLFYQSMNERGKLRKRFSDFSLEIFFERSLKEFTSTYQNVNTSTSVNNTVTFTIDGLNTDAVVNTTNKYSDIAAAMTAK